MTKLPAAAAASGGKTGILFKVTSAVAAAPDGSVREAIFPMVDERTFETLDV